MRFLLDRDRWIQVCRHAGYESLKQAG
jgi:hypothetical protein